MSRTVSRDPSGEYKPMGTDPQVTLRSGSGARDVEGDGEDACCYCCYRRLGRGEAKYLCLCTHGRVCCCSFFWLILLLLGAQGLVGYYVGSEFISRHTAMEQNLTSCRLTEEQLKSGNTFCGERPGSPRWTPPNVTYSMWFPACTNTLLVREMRKFNAQNRWSAVTYPSAITAPAKGEKQQEPVTLEAWWLPVENPLAPRVAIFHGTNANFNDWSVQLPAYMLRSMGFAVLLPNLRDYGLRNPLPNASSHVVSWGWAYFLDVLGAVDYLVRDPDGQLGGPVAPSQVGLMGFSMGGFAVATALGLRPDVAGAWLDSAFADPRRMMEFGLSKVMGPAAPAFVPASWLLAKFLADKRAGADLALMTPAKTLGRPESSSSQPAEVAESRADGAESNFLAPTSDASLVPAPSSAPSLAPHPVVPTGVPTVAPATPEMLPATEAPVTTALPEATAAPATEAPTTEAPVVTEAPTTEAPATEPPTTTEEATEAPTTEAPTTETPATEAPSTTEAPAATSTEASATAHGPAVHQFAVEEEPATTTTARGGVAAVHEFHVEPAPAPSAPAPPGPAVHQFDVEPAPAPHPAGPAVHQFAVESESSVASVEEPAAGATTSEHAPAPQPEAGAGDTGPAVHEFAVESEASVASAEESASATTSEREGVHEFTVESAAATTTLQRGVHSFVASDRRLPQASELAEPAAEEGSSSAETEAAEEDDGSSAYTTGPPSLSDAPVGQAVLPPFNCSTGFTSEWSKAKEAFCGKGRRLQDRALSQPIAPTQRCIVAVIGGQQDNVVPPSEVQALADLIRGNPQFELKVEHFNNAVCGGRTHHVWAAARPQDYRARLCAFWSQAFARPQSECGLEDLPRFHEEVGSEPGWQEAPSRPLFS